MQRAATQSDEPSAGAAEAATREAYDRVPYPSAAQHHTHPDNLATLAVLHGLEPPPVAGCRVLELGCADGGNLIAMAAGLPGARFVGVDLSPRQIAVGRREVEALGLGRVELEAMSLMEVDDDFGRFDYVIAHGVFSWVPAEVQEKILSICRRNLAPGGVAYVSYNTYPGWHLRGVVRDVMRYHTRGEPDPVRRTTMGRELIELLATAAEGRDDAQALFLRATREHLEEYRDRPSYLIHEYLEESNTPEYFHRFAERAAAHGLAFLAEAGRDPLEAEALPPPAVAALDRFAADPVERGQYLDFFTDRAFRRSLLVAADVPVDRSGDPAPVRRLIAASPVRPADPDAELTVAGPVQFRGPRGAFSADHPAVKVALAQLGERWPEGMAVSELAAVVARRVDAAEAETARVLAELLRAAHLSGVVDLSTLAPACTRTVSAAPRASALARRQAAHGELVCNRHHRVTRIDDPVARRILSRLDGSRGRDELIDDLAAEAEAGRLELSVEPGRTDAEPPGPGAEGAVVAGAAARGRLLAAVVDHHLARLAEYALLVA